MNAFLQEHQTKLILVLSIICLALAAFLVHKGRKESFEYTTAEQGKMCEVICKQMQTNPIWGGEQTYERCMQTCPNMFTPNVWVPGVYLTPFTRQ